MAADGQAADVPEAAGGADAPPADAPPGAAAPEPDPGPPSVEPEASVEPAADDEPAAGEAPELDLPDPLHLIGDRPCPVCEGAGTIPFGVLQSPRFRPCDECGGIGQVLTGSLRPEASVFDCPGCEGAGYKTVPQADTPAAPPQPQIGPEGPPPWPGATYDHVAGAWA